MGEAAHHGPGFYVKIYGILLVLLIVSILGPEIGIKWVTLVTAFGIALVKALMVCAYFMHLNIEKRYIWYTLITMLLMCLLFFAGVAPDVMNTTGARWENKSSLDLIEQHKNQDKNGGQHHN